jgi:hypothetical protein
MSADIYDLIVREIPQLRGDKRVLTLLEASVGKRGDPPAHHPARHRAGERARAGRGGGLRPPAGAAWCARIGAAARLPHRVSPVPDWCLEELGRSTDNASIVSAAALRIAEITSAYIDKVSEELLSRWPQAGRASL